MVDNVNPNTQFHPYQAPDVTPIADQVAPTGLGGMLSKLGIDPNVISGLGGNLKNLDLNGQLNKARGVAQKNPGLVLGGLAALVIGAGLLRNRKR